ncbi:MAG: DUF4097 family beta strand repeat-containing protein [Lachnospiraceae bacterium]
MTIESGSGDILTEMDLIFSECSISASSGDVSLEVLTSDNITVKTASGDIRAEKTIGEQNLTTSSGIISIKDSEGNVNISTTSGDTMIGGAKGHLAVRTSSGTVLVSRLSGSIAVKTSSGDIHLKLRH